MGAGGWITQTPFFILFKQTQLSIEIDVIVLKKHMSL